MVSSGVIFVPSAMKHSLQNLLLFNKVMHLKYKCKMVRALNPMKHGGNYKYHCYNI
jgi:hypothetical protein